MWRSDDEEGDLLSTDKEEHQVLNQLATTDRSVPKRTSSPWFLLPAAACVASLGGILFGYDIGIISGAILLLREEFNLSCSQQEIVVTSLLMGGVFASFVGGHILDHFGRKLTIIFNAGIFILGALVLTFSHSYPTFIAGRFVLGFAVSLSAVGDCVYISEIAPPNKRGLLVSLNEFGITVGILFAYLVNYLLFNTKNGWRYMFGISIIPAILQGLGMIFLPASPRWLITKGKDTKATQLINVLWPHLDAQKEYERLKESLSHESTYSIFDLFGKRENMRMRMFVGMGIIFFQQLTGQPTVLYYAPALFKILGFDQNVSATLATVGLGVVKVIFTFITLCLVDRLGRRTFLLAGSVVMTVSLVLLSALTFQNLQARPKCNEMAGTYKLHTHLILPKYCNSTSLTQLNITANNTWISLQSTNSPFTKTTIKTPYSRNCTIESQKNNTNGDLVNTNISSSVKYLCLISLMVFVIGFAIGFGPMGWLVLSEIFPTGIKGRAVAAATIANWGTNIILSMVFLELLASIGTFWTFLSYAMIGAISIFFLAYFVPETKGKSLETISAEFNHNVICCRTVGCCAQTHILLVNDERNGLLQDEQQNWHGNEEAEHIL